MSEGQRETLANVSDDFLQYQYKVLGVANYLARPDVTEICINQPGHLYLETMQGWQKVEHDTWKVVIPNKIFADFNPYGDLIHGDWFSPQGREHHTGAVYLEGIG